MRYIYRARAPLRLGLAGGGTDVSPFSEIHGGAVLNATISRYAQASVTLHDEPVLRFRSIDLDRTDEIPLSADPELKQGLILHRATTKVMGDLLSKQGRKLCGLSLVTDVESPIGSGLGSSSAMAVAMVEALREAFSLALGEYDVARLAYHIEREVAGFAGGKQDQYAATFGGVNYMEFLGNDQVIVNPLRMPARVINELEATLLMCFSGLSRDSAHIIKDQSRSVLEDGDKMQALIEIKRDAMEAKNALLLGNTEKLAKILRRSWEAKKRTSELITNAPLEKLMDTAFARGALAGKVSGAGGGGFMFFVIDPLRRKNIVDALKDLGAEVSRCNFVSEGSVSWRTALDI